MKHKNTLAFLENLCYTYISTMKTAIHPQLNNDVIVSCVCGNTFTTKSVKPSLNVEVCHKCHPFFTGEQRFLDTKGHVDRFIKKQQMAKDYQAKMSEKKAKKDPKQKEQPKSLRELLGQM